MSQAGQFETLGSIPAISRLSPPSTIGATANLLALDGPQKFFMSPHQ